MRPGAEAAPRPVPRALCAACGRPVAQLRSPNCVYCGAAIPEALRGGATAVAKPGLPPEMLQMLEPRPRDASTSTQRWMLRILAAAVAGLILMVILRMMQPHG